MHANILKALFLFSSVNCLFSPCHAVISDPGSRGIDWDQVRSKIEKHKWADDIYKQMQRDFIDTQKLFAAQILDTTGWTHEYYCDDTGRLIRK